MAQELKIKVGKTDDGDLTLGIDLVAIVELIRMLVPLISELAPVIRLIVDLLKKDPETDAIVPKVPK